MLASGRGLHHTPRGWDRNYLIISSDFIIQEVCCIIIHLTIYYTM